MYFRGTPHSEGTAGAAASLPTTWFSVSWSYLVSVSMLILRALGSWDIIEWLEMEETRPVMATATTSRRYPSRGRQEKVKREHCGQVHCAGEEEEVGTQSEQPLSYLVQIWLQPQIWQEGPYQFILIASRSNIASFPCNSAELNSFIWRSTNHPLELYTLFTGNDSCFFSRPHTARRYCRSGSGNSHKSPDLRVLVPFASGRAVAVGMAPEAVCPMLL